MQTKQMNQTNLGESQLTIFDFVGDQHCLGSLGFFYNPQYLLDATSSDHLEELAESFFIDEVDTAACFFFTKIKNVGSHITVCVGEPENVCGSRRVYRDKVDFISLYKFHGIPIACVHASEVEFIINNKEDIVKFFKESGGLPVFFVVFSGNGVITEGSGVTKLNSVFGSSFTMVKTAEEEKFIYNENVITCLNLT